jgi:hypothetical protein
MEYMLRFRRERRPRFDPRLKYMVGGVLLNLTGPKQIDRLAMPMPAMPGYGMSGCLPRLPVREEKAALTLARIASGALDRSVLPWVPLMQGSDELAIIEEWKRVADLEPDVQLRLDYGSDALIFAELPSVWQQWKHALGGWNVKVSQQVLEWQAEARAEGRAEGRAEAEVQNQRTTVLRVLEKRCKAAVPKDLIELIQATQDLGVLVRWLDAAVDATTFDEFRAAIQSGR